LYVIRGLLLYSFFIWYCNRCAAPCKPTIHLRKVLKYGALLILQYTCEGCGNNFVTSSDPLTDPSTIFKPKGDNHSDATANESMSFAPKPPSSDQQIGIFHGSAVNNRLVWASMATGMGHSQLSAAMAYVGLNPLSLKTYSKIQKECAKVIYFQHYFCHFIIFFI